MPLTPAERETRLDSIGASEAASVLGVDPYKTGYETWAVKTRRVEEFNGNAQTDAGSRFEPVVLDWAEEQLGRLIRNTRIKLENAPIAATLDGAKILDDGRVVPVEAKTGGLFGPLSDVWGREGTDEVPERYIVQAHVQMIVTEAELAHMPCFLGGRGFVMYRIRRSERLASFIRERLCDWWNRYVVADTPPEYDPLVVAEVQRRIIRTPNKVVDVPAMMVADYEAASLELKAAEEKRDRAKAFIIDALQDAEVGEYGGDKQITFYEQDGSNIDAKALRAAHPDIAEQFTRRRSSRALRFVKKKG